MSSCPASLSRFLNVAVRKHFGTNHNNSPLCLQKGSFSICIVRSMSTSADRNSSVSKLLSNFQSKMCCSQRRMYAANGSSAEGNNNNTEDEQEQKNRRAIAVWLFFVTGMTFIMIVIGGITRLTESGLSITEWKPIVGALPPMTPEEWQHEFELYTKSPEFYKQRDVDNFTVEDFKGIWFWEWFHRLFGRGIGAAYALPWMYFTAKGRVPKGMQSRLAAIAVVGALQGCMGWVMVASGLDPKNFEDGSRVRVSHYRLTLHLGAAFVLYTGLFWTGMQAMKPLAVTPDVAEFVKRVPNLRRVAAFTAAWVFLTSMSGGFVAGLDAGQIFNEWPLMAGQIIPMNDIYLMEPAWRSAFDHDATVQFNHRMLATATVVLVLAMSIAARRVPLPSTVKTALMATEAMVTLQAVLGIVTLLSGANTELAATHQGGAVALFTALLWLAFSVRTKRAPF